MASSHPVMRDTTRQAAAVYYSALRRTPPEDRAQRALELSDQIRAVLEAGVRHRHPEHDQRAVQLATIRLWLGEDSWLHVAPKGGGKAVTDSGTWLGWLIVRLEEARIAYMVSGSLASAFHGEYRATNDIDVVISPTPSQLEQFLESLGDEIYVSPTAARQALRDRSMFNVIHTEHGFKADLIVRKDRPFSVEEFKRRKRVEMLGIGLYVVSPEDAILSKLEWSRAGQSERQFRDALGIAIVQGDSLDLDYLQRWARELNVDQLLERLLREARGPSPPD